MTDEDQTPEAPEQPADELQEGDLLPPATEPRSLTLERVDVLELVNANMQVELAHQRAARGNAEWQMVVQTRKQEKARQENDISAAESIKGKVVSEIGEKYGVDLTKCTFDPESGELTVLEE